MDIEISGIPLEQRLYEHALFNKLNINKQSENRKQKQRFQKQFEGAKKAEKNKRRLHDNTDILHQLRMKLIVRRNKSNQLLDEEKDRGTEGGI